MTKLEKMAWLARIFGAGKTRQDQQWRFPNCSTCSMWQDACIAHGLSEDDVYASADLGGSTGKDDAGILEDLKVVQREGLQVGRRYCIEFEDCCVQGIVPDTYYVGHDEEDDRFMFHRINLGPGWGTWTAKELKVP